MPDWSVKVALDVTVPTQFGPHRVCLDHRNGRTVSVADVCVRMVDGRPYLIRVDIAPGNLADDQHAADFAPEDLAGVDWHKAAWDAVRIEAGFHVWTSDTLTPDEMVDRMRAVDRTAEESRRYNRLNRQQLDEVADLWREGGARAVAKHFCVSRRQADRYVVKAREAGAL